MECEKFYLKNEYIYVCGVCVCVYKELNLICFNLFKHCNRKTNAVYYLLTKSKACFLTCKNQKAYKFIFFILSQRYFHIYS
jgi:hypothetical protein